MGQSLEEQACKGSRCWEDKRRVTYALLDGRLTPRQAADQFRDLNADLPAEVRRSHQVLGNTEEEWACRKVLAYVDYELVKVRRAPARAREWASRLEGEFRGQLRPGRTDGGCRVLPGLSPPPTPGPCLSSLVMPLSPAASEPNPSGKPSASFRRARRTPSPG
jgi:hypothetical protein